MRQQSNLFSLFQISEKVGTPVREQDQPRDPIRQTRATSNRLLLAMTATNNMRSWMILTSQDIKTKFLTDDMILHEFCVMIYSTLYL